MRGRWMGGVVVLGLWGCGGAEVGAPTLPDAQVVGYGIAPRAGGPLRMRAGDALALEVVARLSDGSARPLPPDARVSWTAPATVSAIPPRASPDGASPLPAPADGPTAIFVANPGRAEHREDLTGVLFALDPGAQPGAAVTVTAQVQGAGAVQAEVEIDAPPPGDPVRGAARFGPQGFDCAACHGDRGEGSSGARSSGVTAPPLALGPDTVGQDPAWSAPRLALAALADLDDQGVCLREPMPDFLRLTDRDGRLLDAQDAADLFSFLQAQQP